MKKRFVFIAALAFSFVFPVALSGLGLPVGEAMAQNTVYTVEVTGDWSGGSGRMTRGRDAPKTHFQQYEIRAHTQIGARSAAISMYKKKYFLYTKNVKAKIISAETIPKPKSGETTPK